LLSDTADLEVHTRLTKSASFYYHALDLRPDVATVFRGFHKSCVQRKIQRAFREGLTYEEGRSEVILRKFYSLLLLTRRRHGGVPQPLAWFRALVDCLREALKIRVVCKNGEPVASTITLYYRNRLIYKYGCSDDQFHKLGGMALLFWRTIQDGKALEVEELDLGRSDRDHRGLIDFKRRLGAIPSVLNYYRYPRSSVAPAPYWKMRFVPALCARLPHSMGNSTGKLLYRHIG